jgi:ribosomal protein L37AE/L43A
MKIEILVAKLEKDFPEFQFRKSSVAHWSPTDRTISYTDDTATLLHELGHALLGHNDFVQDIELIHLERDAWEKALEVANEYGVKITDDTVEAAMDDYRDWLHARSLCPKCSQTGIQSRADLTYSCLNCDARWAANDARACGLKRRLVKTKISA